MNSIATAEFLRPKIIESVYLYAARLDRFGMGVLRLGLVVVLVWIGSLKFEKYEADSVVPLVANSPFMSFFYTHPAPEYRSFMNKEGEFNSEHRLWHKTNGTYPFSYGLGCMIIFIGLLIAIMLGAAVTTMADSAETYLGLNKQSGANL